jgi:hypothetical protein
MKKRTRKKIVDATTAGVKKELAKPRMSKSARIAELKLDVSRIPEQPSTMMSRTVDKIISSRRPRPLEKAQIAVDGADHRHRDLRIDDMKLKKGAHVELTVTAKDVNRHN